MLLERIKTAMRITHSKLDDEIQLLISACCDELKRVGVQLPNNQEDLSPLIEIAVKLYVMAQFDYLGKGEKYKKNFEELRDALSLSAECLNKAGDELV